MPQTVAPDLLAPIHAFLGCETPEAWIEQAVLPENLDVVLLDHLVCELKAAQSAMYLIRKYAVDEVSGQALLAWLKPFEDFTYRMQGDWQSLATKCAVERAIGDRDAQHVGVQLQVDPIHQAQRLEFVLRQGAVDAAFHLSAKLSVAFRQKCGIEVIVLIH